MTVNTRDFGTVEIDEKDLITFSSSIIGFDDHKKFLILIDEEINGFAWLQSAEDENVCFVLASPDFLGFEYAPSFSEDVEKLLGGNATETWLIAAIPENMENTTVNLKSPILINMNTNKAAQLISDDKLPVRYELFSGKEID